MFTSKYNVSLPIPQCFPAFYFLFSLLILRAVKHAESALFALFDPVHGVVGAFNQFHHLRAVVRVPGNAAGNVDARRRAVGQVEAAVFHSGNQPVNRLLC